MKILTFNTHSLLEENYEEKLKYFVQWLDEQDYDIVALQEINQKITSEILKLSDTFYYSVDEAVKIKKDNHLFRTVELLREKGKNYYWTWTPIKIGYDKFDEGIGILSKYEPKEIKEFYLTESKAFTNWKVRKALGIKVEIDGEDRWFFSLHAGWWNDSEEGFQKQLFKLNKELRFLKGDIYLMGDFNNPADIRDEGYDSIISGNWKDTYTLAEKKDEGITVEGLIDGWKEYKNLTSMRIDFIFKNNDKRVKESKVVFNGKNGDIISDHFGVEILE